MRFLKAIVILTCLFFSSVMAADEAAKSMLKQSADNILVVLKQNQGKLKSNPEIIYQAVRQNFLPNVDVAGMSRSVLGRAAWNQATPAQRKQFAHEFTRLVIRTYASPLAEYSGETIRFLPSRAEAKGRFTRVNSVILRSNGQRIPLSYSLVRKGSQWKVYDLSVEGVSLLQSFRSQFAQALQGSNIAGLILKLQEQNSKAG